MRLALLAALALFAASPALAQSPASPAPAAPAAPVANMEDVTSIDSTLAALYDVISGEAGPRDWDRFQSLFLPGATLGVAGRSADGQFRTRMMTPADYQARNGAHFAENPFFERELGRKVERFGPIASVMSAYESRRSPDAAPFDRGVNAIHMVHDGQRWWVVSIYWTSETAENPIPADLIAAR